MKLHWALAAAVAVAAATAAAALLGRAPSKAAHAALAAAVPAATTDVTAPRTQARAAPRASVDDHAPTPAQDPATITSMEAFLRERAAHRALILTAARARAIALGPAQQAQLLAVREQAEARPSTQAGPRTREAIEQEVADAEADLLLVELLAANGVAPPGPTAADVERYRAEHRAEASQQTEPEIRAHLLTIQADAWNAARIALLAELERKAGIEAPPH